ncbi:hypothetical protein [Streptomyces sp. NBC_01506]|uniref:hypothetical protein n=1 Tax=Streptomyces sp. NBC_01506 TaxID=2903887 RepID=UPI00386A4DCF
MTDQTMPDPLAYGPTGYLCGYGKNAHSNLVPCQPGPDPDSLTPEVVLPQGGDPDCERCDGTGLDPDAYTEQQNPDGDIRYHAEPCTGLLCTAARHGVEQ